MSNPEKNCEQLFSLSMILQGYWCSLISVWKQASSKRVDDFNSETARDCFSAGKKGRGFKSSNLNRRALSINCLEEVGWRIAWKIEYCKYN